MDKNRDKININLQKLLGFDNVDNSYIYLAIVDDKASKIKVISTKSS